MRWKASPTKKAILDRYNELAVNYSDETADEMAEAAGPDRQPEPVGSRIQVEQALDALRCPPGDAAVDNLSGGEKRRVALCQLLL